MQVHALTLHPLTLTLTLTLILTPTGTPVRHAARHCAAPPIPPYSSLLSPGKTCLHFSPAPSSRRALPPDLPLIAPNQVRPRAAAYEQNDHPQPPRAPASPAASSSSPQPPTASKEAAERGAAAKAARAKLAKATVEVERFRSAEVSTLPAAEAKLPGAPKDPPICRPAP